MVSDGLGFRDAARERIGHLVQDGQARQADGVFFIEQKAHKDTTTLRKFCLSRVWSALLMQCALHALSF